MFVGGATMFPCLTLLIWTSVLHGVMSKDGIRTIYGSFTSPTEQITANTRTFTETVTTAMSKITPMEEGASPTVLTNQRPVAVNQPETNFQLQIRSFPTGVPCNTWFVSDFGSDDNDCHLQSAPCRNLQTVLDRAIDGADIYVTSNTLSLDAVHTNTTVYIDYHREVVDNKSFTCCHVYSSKSYSIRSINGSPVNVICSDHCIQWIQQDSRNESTGKISDITLRNLLLKHSLIFELYGTATFEECFIHGEPFLIYLKANWIESNISLKNINFYSMRHSLQFIGTKFDMTSDTALGLHIHIVNCSRGIIIRKCTFLEKNNYLNEVYFTLGDQSNSDIATVVSIYDCYFYHFFVYFHPTPKKSSKLIFLFVQMNNTVFNDSVVFKNFYDDNAVFVVENCSLVGFESRPRALHLMDVFYVSLSNCKFQTYNLACWQGCAVSVRGVPSFRLKIDTFSEAFPFIGSEAILIISDSQFVGSTAQLSGGVLSCIEANLKISNSTFEMTANSKPPPIGGFIYHEGGLTHHGQYSVLDNVILDATHYGNRASLLALTVPYDVKSLSLFCPQSLQPKLLLKGFTVYISCEISCQEAYTFKAGNMSVDMKQNYSVVVQSNGSFSYDRYVSNISSPIECFPCPIGAICNGTAYALPNHWGYKNQANFVTMIRCPDGYCCQGDDTCTGIDSCNTGRTGTLCGNCRDNLTESLFSPTCISQKKCHTYLILALYFFCVLIYTIFLLFVDTVKDKLIQIFKKCSKFIKNRCHSANRSPSTNVSSITMHNEDASNGSGMKYIQILFFYVQDAALFKVHLPDDHQGESLFVQIIQFSPDVLASFLRNTADTCFTSDSPAVIKMLFQSLFGPTVMVFLLLIFLIQRAFSKYHNNCSASLKVFKYMLVQAFLLALLFSLQKIVIGAFSLVQCVNVGESKVLYIQGDIECYTWWQVLVQIIIFGNVIPVLFVLSLSPFYVQNEVMSTRLFVITCILPVPSLIYFIITQWTEGRKVDSEENRIEGKMGDQNVTGTNQVQDKHYSGPENEEIPFIDENSVSEEINIRGEQKDLDKIFRDQETQTNGNSALEEETSCSSKEPKTMDVILYTLLEQYKPLHVCGVHFTWLAIHKLYRVVLVACNTYITEPLQRLWLMTSILILVLIANIFVRPYKESLANKAAILSYTANLCIAIINISKTMLATFDCKTNCSVKETLLWYFSLTENILLIYLPVAAAVCWVVSIGVKKCKSKSKDE